MKKKNIVCRLVNFREWFWTLQALLPVSARAKKKSMCGQVTHPTLNLFPLPLTFFSKVKVFLALAETGSNACNVQNNSPSI